MVITIREKSQQDGAFETRVSFDHKGSYKAVIKNPFDVQKEEQLDWYFEKWLRFPFVDKVKAENTAHLILDYGDSLFEQVFDAKQAFAKYREGFLKDPRNIRVEIEGSPAFHSLHWECLRDPDTNFTFAIDGVLIRKPQEAQVIEADFEEAPAINLLLVTARPSGKYDVGYRTISRPLVEMLDSTALRVNVDILRPASFEAFAKHLEKNNYHIIHFDMHGNLLSFEQYQKLAKQKPDGVFFRNYGRGEIKEYQGQKAFLFFESSGSGKSCDNGVVEASDLANFLISKNIPIVILNACQSGKQIVGRSRNQPRQPFNASRSTNGSSNGLLGNGECC